MTKLSSASLLHGREVRVGCGGKGWLFRVVQGRRESGDPGLDKEAREIPP